MPERQEQRSRAKISKPVSFMLVDVYVEAEVATGSTFCMPKCLGAHVLPRECLAVSSNEASQYVESEVCISSVH